MKSPEFGGGIGAFTYVRRTLVALGIAGAVAGILRLRGDLTPPTRGGWRELAPDELADDAPGISDVLSVDEIAATPFTEVIADETQE